MMADQLLLSVELMVFLFLPFAVIYVFLSQKITADLQARIGPKEVGAAGALQVFADAVKLMVKRSAVSTDSTYYQKAFIFCLVVAATFSAFTSLPIYPASIESKVSLLVVWPILSLLASPFLVVLGSRKSDVEFLSAFRRLAQALVGAVPLFVTIVSVGILAGGFSWSEIIAAQGSHPGQWLLVSSPVMPIIFVLFVASGMSAIGVTPMSSHFLEGWSGGGFGSQFSGIELLIFAVLNLFSRFLLCLLAVCLFLGGVGVEPGVIDYLLLAPKMGVLALLVLLIEKTTVRLRADHVTQFVWKFVIPLATGGVFFNLIWLGGVGS